MEKEGHAVNMDTKAIERIKELEDALEDAYVKIDLQQETIDEQAEHIKVLKAQHIADIQLRKANYEVA